MNWESFVIGIFGTLVGGIITFVSNQVQKKSEKSFEMTVAIRTSLLTLYQDLSSTHGTIMNKYYEIKKLDPIEAIVSLKEEYDEVLELYKMYRINFGDSKLYELQSSLFNYAYECAFDININKRSKVITEAEFEVAYESLKDACMVMLNEVRYKLIEINTLKRLTKKDLQDKEDAYMRYADRTAKNLEKNHHDLITNYIYTEDKSSKLIIQTNRFMVRIHKFYEEYKNHNGTIVFSLPKLKEVKEK